MRECEIPVKFDPQGKTVHVLKGTTVTEAAVRAGILLNSPCGGRGTCGKCIVRVMQPQGDLTSVEKAILSSQDIADGKRLACQCAVTSPVTINVPQESLLESTIKILGGAVGQIADVSRATVRKRYVELPLPTRGDELADVQRIQRALGETFSVEPSLLRELPRRLRALEFRGTAVFADHRMIDFEEGDTTSQCYAVAVDIGTTTLVAVLIDLVTGRECAAVTRMNPQTRFGDDVVSRIQCARESSAGLADLHQAVTHEISDMCRELCAQCGTRPEHIYEAVFSGNTTMQQLFADIDPWALGEVPFVPATSHSMFLRAADLGVRIHPHGCAYVFPVIGGFVGGDTVAGIVASGITEIDRPAILVDIGTNGEIVIRNGDKYIATSTAAGPAFEGARITHGMRGTTGAIEQVLFNGGVRINVIGDTMPVGLCGSALVDAVAELLRSGALIPQGLLLMPDQLPKEVPPFVAERIVVHDGMAAFVLAAADESGTGRPILLTQRDIRELQLAAAAIRAGLNILLRRVGLDIGQIDRILLAGGFGNFIRRENAQRIGLLPSEIEIHRIRPVGNTSIAGARFAAVSQDVRAAAESLARDVEHVDLSLDPAFQMEFVEAMVFPEERNL